MGMGRCRIWRILHEVCKMDGVCLSDGVLSVDRVS